MEGSTLDDIAAFLATLHTQPLDLVDAPLSPEALREARHELAEADLPALERLLTRTESRRVREWWHEVASDRRLDDYEPALRHGDAWYGNLLVGPNGRLCGVLDWEAAAAADPALDLAVQRHLGSHAGQRVVSTYRSQRATDPNFDHRIRRHWELRELGTVSWALEMDDREELDDTLRKWRGGPVLAGS